METGRKSHVDLEDDGGGGRRHSPALSDGGTDNRSSISSDAYGRSRNSPSCSTAGASSSYNEQQRPSCLSAIEIVGLADKRRESSASVEVVDLEAGVPAEAEAKAHLEKSERDCRICHLSLDATNPESGIPIDLGCSCKDDLAAAHKHCAEAWFKIKGNKICEICGSTACNIAGANGAELMEQWNDGNDAAVAAAIAPLPQAEARNFLQGHRFLNCLLACMVFAFVIFWLFHFNVPS